MEIRIQNIDLLKFHEATYETWILRTYVFLKAHSDSSKNILESTSDIPWKYNELIFSNTLSPITQCSSASPSVSEQVDMQVDM